MKKMALMLAVIAVLSLAVISGPALAQNHANFTNITTANSSFFGFQPTVENLGTFLSSGAGSVSSCTNGVTTVTTGLIPMSGTWDCNGPAAYVPLAGIMPGSFTDSPNRLVSAVPDFGCGVWTTSAVLTTATVNNATLVTPLTSGSGCVETVLNIEDRVNGNTAGSTSALAAVVNSLGGQNTAPTADALGAGGQALNPITGVASGALIGNFTSQVVLDDLEDGMPGGLITFNRSSALTVTFDQSINQNTSSDNLGQVFSEHDYTGAAGFLVYNPVFTAPITGGTQSSRNSGTRSGFSQSNLGIFSELSLSQNAMGGEGTGTDSIAYTTTWQGNGTAPIAGNFFTPGLNVTDWANGTAGNGAGFPN